MRESKAKPSEEITAFPRGVWVSVPDAGKRYPMGKDWFYQHIKAGTLPFDHYELSPGVTVMDTADIEDYINRCKVPAGKLPGEIKEAV